MRILHFADAHIDMVTQGRHDPKTGFAIRTLDFLKAMDHIIDHALKTKPDLVIFAGDAYKDRTPVPTFQREWGARIITLSQAKIPTLLIVGNHDMSPAAGRANTLQEFQTLAVPHVHVAGNPHFYSADELGIPLQVMALPWWNRSSALERSDLDLMRNEEITSNYNELLAKLVNMWFQTRVDASLPVILASHASIQGAVYGGERTVMLGGDLVIPPSLVKDPRFNYVALGHIHKAQNLNEGLQPPVIYPGSIERVNFGEAADDKFFVTAEMEVGEETRVTWHPIPGRTFIDKQFEINNEADAGENLLAALPDPQRLKDTIFRLTLNYPIELENAIDEQAIRRYAAGCLEFHLIRKPVRAGRIRIPENTEINSLGALELLNLYLDSIQYEESDREELIKITEQIVNASSDVIPAQGEY